MNESIQGEHATNTIKVEICDRDIQNCIALSVDSRIDSVAALTSEVEELLGIHCDMGFRNKVINFFRQSAVEKGVPPSADSGFGTYMDEFYNLLQDQKSILLGMYKCCEEFCSVMHNELEAINQSFVNHPEERAAFIESYMQSNCSQYECPKLLSGKRQRRNRLPSHALSILWDFVRTHKKNPYPSTQQKEALARQTKLTMTQIRNWFTNTRKRKLSQAPESDEDYSIGSDSEESYSSPPPEESTWRRSQKRRAERSNTKMSKTRKGPVDLTLPLPLSFVSSVTPEDANLDRTTNPVYVGKWIQHAESGIFSSAESRMSYGKEKEETKPSLEMKIEPQSPVGTPRFDSDFSLLEPGSIRNSGIGFVLPRFYDDPKILGLNRSDLQDDEYFNNNNIVMRKKDGEESEATIPQFDEMRVEVNSNNDSS